MKRLRNFVISILCMSILFFNIVSSVEAEEMQDLYTGYPIIDIRPDYTVFVNRVLNYVTVVQQEEDGTATPVKSMVCSCGREGHETPEGVFQTSDYYDWRLMVDGTYGRYAVRFNGKILFHSVPYIEPSPDTLEWEEYNKLGENASLGCVRLSAEDAKWIYDNCKPGTTVVVYSDSEVAGLLEKPTAVQIAEDSPCRGWDPTDIDINNPWFAANYETTVSYTDLASIPGTDYDITESASAPLVGTVDEFDYAEYAERYPDVVDVFGYDKNLLYAHYIVYGIKEGRIATFK